jgi:hypothetical protein
MGADDAVRLATILSSNREHLGKLQELDVSRNLIGAKGALAFNEKFALLLPADRNFTMSLVQNDISNEQAGLLNLQGSLLRPRQKLAVLAPRTGAQNVEGGILVVKLRDQEFRFRCTWTAVQERINACPHSRVREKGDVAGVRDDATQGSSAGASVRELPGAPVSRAAPQAGGEEEEARKIELLMGSLQRQAGTLQLSLGDGDAKVNHDEAAVRQMLQRKLPRGCGLIRLDMAVEQDSAFKATTLGKLRNGCRCLALERW